ncbi:arsenate reductase family protein [Prosthecobacter algae]|uniref:Arsenate reductase family protein n=1 Tax=Prosthecobacter algae TaxID=1144682 RepID=A0ABP9PMT2_9BACT
MLKVYAYQGCSTCKNALKWLKAQGIAHQEIAIRETPPTVPELRSMLAAKGDDLRPLFNTSGQDYRALGMKDKLPTLSTDEALSMLAENGNLVKRPFALDETAGVYLVGFKEAEWGMALKT